MRAGDAADGSRVTGESSPGGAGQEERIQGIRGHTDPEFRGHKTLFSAGRECAEPIRSNPHLSLVTLDIPTMHFLAALRVFV